MRNPRSVAVGGHADAIARPERFSDILLHDGDHASGVQAHRKLETWPPRRVDLGIKGDRIVAIGDLAGRTTSELVNATGKTVAPGFIDTEMTRSTARRQGLDPDQVIAEASKVIPVRRVGQPRDIANVICFLASDEASFVNGQIIYVAGGPRS